MQLQLLWGSAHFFFLHSTIVEQRFVHTQPQVTVPTHHVAAGVEADPHLYCCFILRRGHRAQCSNAEVGLHEAVHISYVLEIRRC